jgi:hypothetical protein
MTTAAPKPLQLKSWDEKNANNQQWFKDNVDYYITRSRFNGQKVDRNIALFYDIYNSKFPMSWFNHITDPLSAKNPAHKSFPAKIRPVNILRTNLDLLQAEYPRRPFIYQVNNLSDDAYSAYQEQLQKAIRANLEQHFQMKVQQGLMEQGLITPDGKPASEEAQQQIQEAMQNLPIPEDVKTEFHESYKDAVAVKGQKWLRRCIQEHAIREKFSKMFKHWVISGEAYSYKTVEFDQIRYKVVSPLSIDYDKSPDEDYVENAEWVVHREWLTLSDVVDRYYEVLKYENLENLELMPWAATPTTFQSMLGETYQYNKVPVSHVTWKGRKLIKFITITDPETGAVEEVVVDEAYKVDKSFEQVEEKWVNELYEGTLLGDKVYVNCRAIPFQRNALNNYSVTKQPYNGRKYSDLHSENTSLTELGLPYLIMYIIVTRTLELTIAKSKGKILLVDQNAIPNEDGWDEEKFFYYAEAMGYGLLNRNQIGVDKSWNQYQVIDMSLFDQIKQLIELQQHFKQEWDDIIGINRQRKGQTYASDLVGVNERATFQSTIITDMIFNLFEEFTQRELNGLLDLSRFTEIEGSNKLWNSTEFGNEVNELNPEEYCNASLGVFVQSSAEAIAIKNKMEANVQAMIQNKARPSTIIDVLTSDNIAELKAKLKRIEEIEDESSKAQQEGEAKQQEDMDNRKMKYAEFQNMLDTKLMMAEYDEKKEIEMIRGEFNTFTFKDGDSNANDTPDVMEVEKHRLERDKHDLDKEKYAGDISQRNADRRVKQEEIASKEKIAKLKPSTTNKK